MLNQAYNTTVTISRTIAPSKEASVRLVPTFRKEFDVVELSIEELASKLMEGYMVVPARMTHQRKDGFVSSDLIFIDIDSSSVNSTEAIGRLDQRGFAPVIGYHTYGSTPENERYRLVFQLSETIEDAPTYEGLIAGIHQVLNSLGIETDSQTKDLTRVSFGGKDLFHMNAGAVLDIDIIPVAEIAQTVRAVAPGRQMDFGLDTGNEIVEALKVKDFAKLKELVAIELPTDFDNLDFISKLNSINISDFFQLPVGRNFSCIFHEDEKPSAGIINTGKNEMYHCFSCGKKHNLIETIARLMKATLYDASKAIEEILDVKLGTEYQENMLHVSHHHKRHFRTSIESLHPELNAWLKRSNLKGLYLALIEVGLDLITDSPLNSEQNLTFFVSQRSLPALLEPFDLKGTKFREVIAKKVNLLAEVGLIVKEADIERKDYIEKANSYKKSKGFRFRTNYITIPMHGTVLADADALVRQRKEQGVRNQFTSTTQAFNQDRDLAKRVYSQSNMEAVEAIVVAEQQEVLALGMELIEQYGYFNDMMLSEELMKHGHKKYQADKMVGAHRPFLINYFELATVSKKLKEERGLPESLKARQKVYLKYQ